MNFLRRWFSRKGSTSTTGPLTLDQAEELWQEAFALFDGNENRGHRKAIRIALRLIEDGPTDTFTRSKLQCFIADIYSQKLGEHAKAIDYYKEALHSNPGNSLVGRSRQARASSFGPRIGVKSSETASFWAESKRWTFQTLRYKEMPNNAIHADADFAALHPRR